MDLSAVEPFTEIICPECETQQVAPMRLGSFLLLAELGKGGMGSVYRAYDETLGRYVAIKVMQKQLAEDQKFAQNFVREARAAAALNHPHVVHIYSCSQEKGQLYLVMELVDGGRLDEMIAGGQALDEAFALQVGVQVAQGLLAANEIGLIHGDIKPANILFDRQQRAKVVDFGLARFAAQHHLQPGEIWGTPFYIAPEKARGQKEDHRADIYSLGATLHHVLTGSPPFDGETARDVVLARLNQPAPPLRTIRPQLHEKTAAVIARALEADPMLRYPTYPSLLADLEAAERQTRLAPVRPVAKEPSRRHLVVAIVIAALLALSVGVALFWHGDPVTPPPLPGPIDVPIYVPPVHVPPEPELVYEIQPFPAAVQERIATAAQAWSDGNTASYVNALGNLFRTQPDQGLERPWVGVLQALPAATTGDETALLRHLRGIQNATLRDLPDDQPHPGVMPQSLARLLTGQLSAAQLRSVAGDWPDWYADLARFFIAIERIRATDLDGAAAELRAYAEQMHSDVAWPYSYQPLARQWLEMIEEWKKLHATGLPADPAAARRALVEYRGRAPALLHPSVDQAIAQADRRIREAEARTREEEQRRREEERRAREARVAQELATVGEARQDLQEFVASRNFARGALELRRQVGTLETEQGRAARDRTIENFQRMEALKLFIIEKLRDGPPVPAAFAPELEGDILSASLAGLRIALGEHGHTTRNWDRVSDRLFAELGVFFANPLPPEERASWLLAVALFAYESGTARAAQIYANEAIKLVADLRDTARAMMPDLELD